MEKNLLLIKMTRIRWVFLMLLCIMLTINLYAQNKVTVTGLVTDTDNEPLIGATIIEKDNPNNGVMAGIDGKYSIVVSSNATIVCSFVGMETKEIVVGNQSVVNFVLSYALNLEEIVVTGYMIQKKADLTGSISVVDVQDLTERITTSSVSALQGVVPGLYIETSGDPTGSSRRILIRGINTLGNTNPLYVIDGIATKDAHVFNYLDPNNIESIQVLKDAAAASIYGSRASNGVIIVTTRQGKDKFRVDVNSNVSVSEHIRKRSLCNTEEYGRALWQAAINDGTDLSTLEARYTYDWHYDADGIPVLDKVHSVPYVGGDETLPATDTDWQDAVFRTGIATNNNITVSGGSSNSSLLVGFGHQANKSIIEYNSFKKLTGQINSFVSFLKGKIKVGENLSMAHTTEVPLSGDHNGPGIANFGSTSVIGNTEMQTRLPIYDTKGNFAGPLGSGFSDRNNPLHIAWLHKDNRRIMFMIFGNAYLQIEPVKNLVLKSTFGVDFNQGKDIAYEKTYVEGFLSRTTNFMEQKDAETFNWTWTNTATYNLNFGENDFDFLLGMEAVKNHYSYILGHKEDFASNDVDYMKFDSATGSISLLGNHSGYTLASYFAKVNYTYSNRYLASVTLRGDGSSRFGKNNRYGFFPAFTFGWRINNEAFMANVNCLSNLKLRGGYGIVGNQDIGNNARFGLYATNYGTEAGNRITGTAYDINGDNTGNLVSGYVRTQLPNDNLKWESTTEYNIGLDFGFFKEKLYGSFDCFFKETKDILTRPPYLSALGEGAYRFLNGATMENKGYEFTLGIRGEAGKFTYNVNYSMSAFADKITYLPEDVISSYAGNGEQTILGHSTSSFFGYKTTGIFQTEEEAINYKVEHGQSGAAVGRLIWADLNNDHKIDAYDQTWLGTSLPKFEYGISGQVGYENFILTIFGQGVYGKNVGNRGTFDFASGQGMNYYTTVLDAWTPENNSSTIPALSFSDSNSETSRPSNYGIVKGDYFKFKTITLSYSLPKSFLSKIKISNLRIYGSAENAIVLRPKGQNCYKGSDPETPGNIFPKPISFIFGINFTI